MRVMITRLPTQNLSSYCAPIMFTCRIYQIKNTVLFSCLLSFIYILGQLEGMGFNRELVLEVFFACNKDEELAANYLLDHGHEFDEPPQ